MPIANFVTGVATVRFGAVRPLAGFVALNLVLVAVLSGAPTKAADVKYVFPVGWRVFPLSAPMSMTPDVFAIALSAVPPATGSRIVQYRGLSAGSTSVVTTDLTAGFVSFVQVSPDGSRVLVHQAPTGLPEHTFRIWMIDANGTVEWRRDDSKIYRFSTTGQVLSAIGPMGEMGAGVELEIYNLNGSRRRRVHLVEPAGDNARPILHDVLLIGMGNRAIVASTQFLWSVSTLSPPTVYWSLPRTSPTEGEVMNIRELDPATIVTDETGRGQFRIVDDTSGTVRYVFDPDALAAHDENPAASRANWATYQPFPGATPGSIVLFNRTKTAFTLDLSSNELTPLVADVSTPLGAMLQSDYVLERAVLLSPTGILLRSRAQTE